MLLKVLWGSRSIRAIAGINKAACKILLTGNNVTIHFKVRHL